MHTTLFTCVALAYMNSKSLDACPAALLIAGKQPLQITLLLLAACSNSCPGSLPPVSPPEEGGGEDDEKLPGSSRHCRHWRRGERCLHDPGGSHWLRHHGEGGQGGCEGLGYWVGEVPSSEEGDIGARSLVLLQVGGVSPH